KIDFGAINDATLIVKVETGTGDAYVKGEDYDVLYDDTDCYVVLLVGGDAYAATKLNVAYNKVNPAAVDAAAVAAGMEKIELCTTTLGMVPDLICAPGFSEDTAVAAVMAAKAAAINGMFRAKALIDIPTDSGKAAAYSDVLTYKNAQALVDENQILCWPLLTFGGKTYHFSTLLAGLMASIDAENSAPYVSPSNKALKCDGMVDAAGAEINLTLDQANTLNAQGVLTALNFMGGWKAWGNYTACYPGSTDVKDMFIPVSRMFDWVANTLIQTFWSRIDMPMNRRLVDSILDTCNIWLNGLVGSGYLLGARCVMLEDENPLTSLMAGIIKLHVYITPPSPAQEIDFALEYDAAYVEAAFAQ
ncbi:MAG: phage tail sheath subtilisin-like domain-containing protein, partial [Bacteroidales bacterium]|nr:phage tail sheath subtilisin-like domain-containing protein [Bacteroidales bacterium]